ncbi:PepSY domain-containing protein [Streptomyces sp. Da 82-17]|uniref:PepSY domain-containing protein n=1 Tax=Streptomyces sp. Da 82-17 TaxID=3377116 RepID=UPI0038D3F1D6
MNTEREWSRTPSTRRSHQLRAAGVLCGVAVLGGLVTGCGSGNGGDGGEKPPKAAAVAEAPVPSQTPSGAGTAKPTGSPSASPSPGSTLTDDQAERKALVPKVKVAYDKALTAAVEAVPDSKPVAIELQSDQNGAPWWDAEVAKTDGSVSKVRVDAVTGKADKPQADSDQDADDKKQLADLLGKAKITPEDAAAVALEKTPKGTVSSVELDDDDQGATIWSVDVVNPQDWSKTSYDVDAVSKKILKQDVDRD